MRFRSLLCRLALILLAAAGPAAAAEPLTPEQKAAVEALIRDYITQHPDAIFDALQGVARTRQSDSNKQLLAANREMLFADPLSPIGGNPKGDVTIVEFFDYRCPYCKEVEPSLEQLIAQDGKLRIVYKEFPILGPSSVYAARVALGAREQGRYDEFHRRMMSTKGTIDDATVERVATDAGIDLAKAKEAIDAPEVDRILRRNFVLAETLQIQGTPAFVIGDQLVQGIADIETLKRLIAEARKGG
jgi:protein-disulfide isomerase